MEEKPEVIELRNQEETVKVGDTEYNIRYRLEITINQGTTRPGIKYKIEFMTKNPNPSDSPVKILDEGGAAIRMLRGIVPGKVDVFLKAMMGKK